MAAACAVRLRDSRGIDALLGATLSFAETTELADYTRMINAGLDELGALLRRDGIL
jgi:hypothetical protein